MSVAKYLPYALLIGGGVVLYRVGKGIEASLPAAPKPMNGMGDLADLGSIFRRITGGARSIVSPVVQRATAPLMHILPAPAVKGLSIASGMPFLTPAIQPLRRPSAQPVQAVNPTPQWIAAWARYSRFGKLVGVSTTRPGMAWGMTIAPVWVDAAGNVMGVRKDVGWGAVQAGGPHLSGLGDLGFSIHHAIQQATQTVTAPLKATVVTPLRVAVAVPLAVTDAVKNRSLSAGVDSLRQTAISPVTSLTKSTTAFQLPVASTAMARVMSAPGARVLFGRAKPVTRSGAPAVTAGQTMTDVQWTPVVGKSGWSTAPGEGGTTVFKGPTGQMFSATPGDISALGGNGGVIDYYLGIGSNTDMPAPAPVSQPSYPAPASGGGGSSGQSYTDPSLDPNYQIPQQSTWGSGGGDPGIIAPGASSAPAASSSSIIQPGDVAPAVDPAPADSSQSVHPLIAVGTLLAVPALLFMGSK